jgi:hypothetical protein
MGKADGNNSIDELEYQPIENINHKGEVNNLIFILNL